MNVLVLNSGSSSLKYQLIDMPSEKVLCNGMIERIGCKEALFIHTKNRVRHTQQIKVLNHHQALEKVSKILLDKKLGVLESKSQVAVVGHRVVHGGSVFSKPVIISRAVKKKIKDLFDLAPLHNPANLEGIEVSENIYPAARQVAIFDTAFHQTLPKVAYQYALPREYLEKHKIRVYGFHGTSHKYVSQKAMDCLGAENAQKIISIHLGNGCSVTAIKQGKSVETSMGFSPISGLVMGTRVGDIDASVIYYLKRHLQKTDQQIQDILQRKSGMFGLTGFSDVREIENRTSFDVFCREALQLAAYRIVKYIGAYIGILEGVDALVFTAGIGENSAKMRMLVCEKLSVFGVVLDKQKNQQKSQSQRAIQSKDSKVKVLVIPTNEELEIAKQSYQLITLK